MNIVITKEPSTITTYSSFGKMASLIKAAPVGNLKLAEHIVNRDWYCCRYIFTTGFILLTTNCTLKYFYIRTVLLDMPKLLGFVKAPPY